MCAAIPCWLSVGPASDNSYWRRHSLDKIVQATERPQRALQGKDKIALRVGKVLQRFKVGKHFQLEITLSTTAASRRRLSGKRHWMAST